MNLQMHLGQKGKSSIKRLNKPSGIDLLMKRVYLNDGDSKKEEMKFITCDAKSGMILMKILEVKPNCSFCGEPITEENFGGVFSKPTRVCCKNICCIIETISFE